MLSHKLNSPQRPMPLFWYEKSGLGIGAEVGTLEAGKRADLALWDVAHPRELAYWIGASPCRAVIKNGRVVGP